EAVCAEHRRDVISDADAVAGAEARGIEIGPVGATCTCMIKVGVGVDERRGAAKWRAHAWPRSSSNNSTNAALAPSSIAVTASSSCAVAAKLYAPLLNK